MAFPAGGTPPYTYAWSNGETGQGISNLTAGAYSVTVTDSDGSTAIETGISVSGGGPPISIATTVTNSTGNDDGAIDISVSGGVPPFTYEWSNGSTDEDLMNLGAGTYTVTVTDNNGCTETATETVTEPNGIFDGLLGMETMVSPNPGNGAFTLNIKNGNPQRLTLELRNVLGQTIERKVVPYPGNEMRLDWNATSWSDGIYFLTIEAASHEQRVLRVVKQR